MVRPLEPYVFGIDLMRRAQLNPHELRRLRSPHAIWRFSRVPIGPGGSSVMQSLQTRSQTHRAARNRSAFGDRGRRRPLVLEALEDRCLLSSYSFKLIADTGPGSPFTAIRLNSTLND